MTAVQRFLCPSVVQTLLEPLHVIEPSTAPAMHSKQGLKKLRRTLSHALVGLLLGGCGGVGPEAVNAK